MSKRKDDGKKKWFDDDEVNNTRLLQVVPPANSEDRIKIDGTITVKARISCCVGAVKQHHSNHATLDGNTDVRYLIVRFIVNLYIYRFCI